MDNTKLIEALNDIEYKKRALEDAAVSIRRALAVLQGESVILPESPGRSSLERIRVSYIDDAEEVLRTLSRPSQYQNFDRSHI